MNILNFLEADGIFLTRKTNSEYAGSCPFCGTGKDRFIVWLHHISKGGPSGGRYWCRQCGKKGDLIQYLRERRGLPFKEACELAGHTVRDSSNIKRNMASNSKGWTPKKIIAPSSTWQERALAFQQRASNCLWTRGNTCLAFLGHRGLKDDTIKEAGLGWNPKDLYEDRNLWNLPDKLGDDGKATRLKIPKGLVIPYFMEKEIIRLRIRRPHEEPRYWIVAGSDTTPLTIGKESGAVVIVESDLDALLLGQEAGDMALMVSLGSVVKRPDKGLHTCLKRANIILNALDYDQAGAKEAWGFWQRTYGNKLKRWPVPTGKDPGEAFQAGIDLREWIEAGLDGDISPHP
ncbi:CHC2 zinc finger [Syntrophus gentianae]|uniref:CHC2 zinc finger n=1 Tax=Syntrophus gentianae TaxID=43775 RepID=A0A1H8B6H6_9BACT|nr:CHC2 zinc finger domain-containing protein [Syntrophus gentianae]SEM78590.1 CHC2 zinc finger [Syntrophus gentianae]